MRTTPDKIDTRTYVRFGSTELELNDANLRLLDPCWAANGSDDILVKNDTVDEFCVLYGAANLLDDTDVSKVNIGRSGSDKAGNCRHSDGRECRRVL